MTTSVVGPWAKDKLDRLGKHLRAYSTIMASQTNKWCRGYWYVDAFAGGGAHLVRGRERPAQGLFDAALDEVAWFSKEQGEQQEFIAGSPQVALEIEPPFSRYVFIEKSPERVASLNCLRDEHGAARDVLVHQGDCNDYLRDHLAKRIRRPHWRAVVFLDPFGMQVPWSTIEALGRTQAIEIFLNFPVGMAIQRLLRRDPSEMTEDRRRPLDDYFGSPTWFDAVYQQRRVQTLFGEEDELEKVEASGHHLVRWYRGRLQGVFPHVSKAALIRNTQRGHLYYLLLASHNAVGVKIADHILSAGETIS